MDKPQDSKKCKVLKDVVINMGIAQMKKEIPIWEKYTLNVEEAASYYGIGVKKIYEIIHDNPNADFLLEVGTHYRIKRILFERFLDGATTI